MSKNLENYNKLLQTLFNIRINNNGLESIEEDQILNKMDTVWLNLTIEEQDKLNIINYHELDAIKYLLFKEINIQKINNILFLADKLHLIYFSRTITKRDNFKYLSIDICNINKIFENNRIVDDYLSISDKNIIDEIIEKFGNSNNKELFECVNKYQESKLEIIKEIDLFSIIENDPLQVPISIFNDSKDYYLGRYL
jgi:hypothetical protein